MENVKILGTGVATMDIYLDRKRMYPGGNEYNVVCNAKLLGAEAGFLGVFANDLAGDLLEQTLLDCGVDTSMCHHEKGSSGYSLVEIKPDGDRVFLEWNHEGVADLYPIGFTDEEIEYAKTFDVLSIGRLSNVTLDQMKRLSYAGVTLCYDFHATFSEEDVKTYAACSRYCFFSCSHLSVESIKEYLKLSVSYGAEVAVGTRGSDSVFAYDGKRFYEQETCRVQAADALGAGDSYIGGFLVYYLNGLRDGVDDPVQNALAMAAKHSATVVRKEGSIGVGYDIDPPAVRDIITPPPKVFR